MTRPDNVSRSPADRPAPAFCADCQREHEWIPRYPGLLCVLEHNRRFDAGRARWNRGLLELADVAMLALAYAFLMPSQRTGWNVARLMVGVLVVRFGGLWYYRRTGRFA